MILRFVRVHLWLFFFQRCYHLSSAFAEEHLYFEIDEGKLCIEKPCGKESCYASEVPANTHVGSLRLQPDLQYRLAAAAADVTRILTLNTSNGELRTISRVDREALLSTGPVRTIEAVVVSHPSISITNVHIRVRDINDNAPAWPHTVQVGEQEYTYRAWRMLSDS